MSKDPGSVNKQRRKHKTVCCLYLHTDLRYLMYLHINLPIDLQHQAVYKPTCVYVYRLPGSVVQMFTDDTS